MIVVGTQSNTSRKAIELAEKYDGVWAAIGLHPSHLHKQEFHDENEAPETEIVKTRSEKFDVATFEELASHPKVVAIGEFGLDYYRLPPGVTMDEMKKDQITTTNAQLQFASAHNLPVIIHCRDAHADQYELLKAEIDRGGLTRRGVIHCYTGTLEEAQKYLELGFYISVTGILTFSKQLQDVVKELPLDRLMIETDAPYLAPGPYRGQRNEPAYVCEVAAKLAEIKGVTFEEVARITTENAKLLFGL
jgi:TatD DNase family protein